MNTEDNKNKLQVGDKIFYIPPFGSIPTKLLEVTSKTRATCFVGNSSIPNNFLVKSTVQPSGKCVFSIGGLEYDSPKLMIYTEELNTLYRSFQILKDIENNIQYVLGVARRNPNSLLNISLGSLEKFNESMGLVKMDTMYQRKII
jgi:hypothetical protein